MPLSTTRAEIKIRSTSDSLTGQVINYILIVFAQIFIYRYVKIPAKIIYAPLYFSGSCRALFEFEGDDKNRQRSCQGQG